MAAVHGKGGSVTFTGAEVTSIQSWTFTSVGETADITGMGDDWRSTHDGATDFTASAEALSQTTIDIPGDVGTEQSLTLQIESGKTIVANAILTSITETVSIDDVGRLSMAFEGDATAVTYPS